MGRAPVPVWSPLRVEAAIPQSDTPIHFSRDVCAHKLRLRDTDDSGARPARKLLFPT
jgi:hypothetical protein